MQAAEKILVVDHDDATREAIAHVLSAAGYQPVQAPNAQSALASVERELPDLVVVDLMLAGASSLRISESLRRAEATRDVPILFVSALGDSQSHRAAIEAGGDDFLTKPIHRGELLLRIRSLLQFRKMQRELAQSNALLVQQRDALLRLQQQKAELNEIIVHDLKNPLAAIVSNAHFLISAREMNDDVRDCAGAISRAAENMLRMVQNLLDVSRGEDAELQLYRERVDFAAMVHKTCSLMSRRAQERRVQLSADAAPDLVANVDADLTRRLLENLLDNAVRYAPRGGTVRISGSIEGDELAITVADGGPGIPVEQRERIFEKYAQLERKSDRAQQRFGRGIGLTFVKMVVDLHGGRIWIEDNEPSGARFQVRLPRS